MKQYQPLYLKYRPQKLSELIGQKVVTKTLSNAIKYERVVHAYLFCGPRGTGKTSTARILAKSLNCEKGITDDPCGQCVSCQSIMQGNSLDVIEIDAASHRKVEDAEDLINRVSLGTYGSRYKIYIIDEVHMLTDHAFNALLKTLEEPPKNVIFILATTEEHKVIPTIVSRCQKLDFKPVVRQELEERIKHIAKKEKINIGDSITGFISRRSYGCLRDAVSLLDQISVLQDGDNLIDPTEVYALFGVVDRSILFNLMESVLTFNRQEAINKAEDLVKSGKDIGELFKGLIELVIDLEKAKIDPGYKKILSSELGNNLEILDKVEHQHLLKIIDRFQNAQFELRYALSQELQFMVEIIGLLNKDFLISMEELSKRVDKLEGKPLKSQAKGVIFESKKEADLVVEQSQEETQDEEVKLSGLDAIWSRMLDSINSIPTKTLLMQSGGHLLLLKDDFIEIGLVKDMFLPRLKNDNKKRDIIIKAAQEATGLNPKEVRYRVVQSLSNAKNNSSLESNIIQEANNTKQSKSSENDDDLSKAVKDLLGAKELS